MFSRSSLTLLLAAALLPIPGTAFAEIFHLKTRDVDTAVEPDYLSVSPARQLHAARRYVMAEFSVPVSDQLLRNLALHGVRVTAALSARGLELSVPAGQTLTELGIKWAGTLSARDKISPALNPVDAKGVWLVEFHTGVPAADQAAIISQTAFTGVADGNLLPNHRLVAGQQADLHQLAEFDEVDYIFPASSELVSGSAGPPCSGALTAGGGTPQYVLMSSGWSPNSPAGVTLNYAFATLTDQLPASQVESEIERAMAQWTAVSAVEFAPGVNLAAPWTIAIEFGTTVNGDPNAFTSTATLAHTYYPAPPNPEPIAGDMHFNPAETWNIGATTDLYTVALHELGHALGLGHTDNPTDVMYPYYDFGAPLSANDIGGVQALYGAPSTTVSGSNPPASGGSGGSAPASPAAPRWSLIPMVVAVSYPPNSFETPESTVSLTGTVLNAESIPQVSWQTNSGAGGVATGGASWSANIPLVDGLNVITLTATDANQKTRTRLLNVLCTSGSNSGTGGDPGASSGTASVVTVTSMEDGATTAATSVTLSGTAADPAGVRQVSWQTSGFASGIASGTTSWTSSSIPLYPGPNVIVVQELNNAGATRWTSLTINRE